MYSAYEKKQNKIKEKHKINKPSDPHKKKDLTLDDRWLAIVVEASSFVFS